MDFSPNKMKIIANFAKIELSEQEINQFSNQLADISKIIDKLKTIDTKDVSPIHNPCQGFLTLREDSVVDGNYPEEIVKNSAKSYMNFFIVPKVIE